MKIKNVIPIPRCEQSFLDQNFLDKTIDYYWRRTYLILLYFLVVIRSALWNTTDVFKWLSVTDIILFLQTKCLHLIFLEKNEHWQMLPIRIFISDSTRFFHHKKKKVDSIENRFDSSPPRVRNGVYLSSITIIWQINHKKTIFHSIQKSPIDTTKIFFGCSFSKFLDDTIISCWKLNLCRLIGKCEDVFSDIYSFTMKLSYWIE